MNKIFFFIVVSIFTLLIFGCNEEEFMTTGTVKYIELEGGFFGIIGDDGNNYDPVNLSKEFQQDGLKIKFDYKIVEGGASFHMWGEMIEILKIEAVN